MSTQASGTYQVTGWEEEPYDARDDVIKLTRARITNSFSGDIEGEGSADCLMAYPSETYASFVGLQRVVGSVGGRSGSFILQTSGVFENGVAKADWFVVPDSGTGDLKGLSGKGGYVSTDQTTCDVKLEYDLG
ncbi:DUF3224 domain-containing protein [Paractinoplanes atraurantiacus]|uniref:DUF3224 domain-containing protein n=1 Tax=Paractinoplanes atraurantiacus TaxID=1036182 RepID=A0A285GLX5_9ACTN|nr:DUF3224 domain-containing protein [Actinoplanes atraurantiacus]SNY24323.1 Protein of unknown function [Actinoplanes atraurantiacus]